MRKTMSDGQATTTTDSPLDDIPPLKTESRSFFSRIIGGVKFIWASKTATVGLISGPFLGVRGYFCAAADTLRPSGSGLEKPQHRTRVPNTFWAPTSWAVICGRG
jgi:hypothetical protein